MTDIDVDPDSPDDLELTEHSGSNSPRPTRQEVPDVAPQCSEAQADGVPCEELGRLCEECERVSRG